MHASFDMIILKIYTKDCKSTTGKVNYVTRLIRLFTTLAGNTNMINRLMSHGC